MLLWAPITVLAATAQVIRNGAQASLTASLGALGAAQVRFLYGLPFAALFLIGTLAVSGERIPAFTPTVLGWIVLGGICQIGATALMLLVMERRAFGAGYAYIKTEPVLVAVMGAVLLGDRLPVFGWIAVVVVTAGVLLASVSPQEYRNLFSEIRMILAGVASGGLFGLSVVAFRGGINALPSGGFVVRSLSALVVTLLIQSILLGIWLAVRNRAALTGSLREWRRSLGAGLAGALASAAWFTAFSLTAAANVRTLALIELPIAALLSGRLTGQKVARHELVGMGIVMAGVALLLGSQG
ncbi:MAG: EamA/RhaT family transporter [Sphingomonadaceae bacterium]|nr:EamA/RhaT family transporter [Sphingomonadaceae bacterium]